ncbi:MAG: glycosyltransferase family 39 protein [Alphaproteobacteria bacterium]|nr:glycosyltransferase family 39 protein [Alphaproteobacteria bacterium]
MAESEASRRTPPPSASLAAALLAVFAALPLLSLAWNPGAYLADPLSELPVKLWGHVTFADGRLFGGLVESVGYPNVGPLNNPDLSTTLLWGALRRVFGDVTGYNLVLWLQLWASMFATWLLGRELSGDPKAALTGAVAFVLTPIVLVYALVGAITDMLNLWPYPLALMYGLRALRREGWRDGLLAGAALGLGLATCPYNFVVFSVIGVPLLLWLPLGWSQGLVPHVDATPPVAGRPAVLRQWGRAVVGVGLLLGLIGGGSVFALKSVMSAETSQMSDAAVEDTRHRPPYLNLRPEKPDRYTAYLVDYVRVGKRALIERDLGSRYYRAFSPGLLLLGLCAAGLVGWRRRWRAALLWPAVGGFGVLASLGPFLPISEALAYQSPVNGVWLALHTAWPGANMLLEPFRYAMVAALGLAMTGTLGVAWLNRRVGGWVGWGAPLALVAELVFVSPVPAPLPTWRLETPAIYSQLDTHLPPGAVIELPYTWKGTAVFNRTHFTNQLTHGRPIPNVVMGFFPRYLVENDFTARLLFEEARDTPLALDHPDPNGVDQGLHQLVEDGFVGIIVTPDLYADAHVADRVRQHLSLLGQPVEADGRLIYRLPAGR